MPNKKNLPVHLVLCNHCDGSGKDNHKNINECLNCDGTGKVRAENDTCTSKACLSCEASQDGWGRCWTQCLVCNGRRQDSVKCDFCCGYGCLYNTRPDGILEIIDSNHKVVERRPEENVGETNNEK